MVVLQSPTKLGRISSPQNTLNNHVFSFHGEHVKTTIESTHQVSNSVHVGRFIDTQSTSEGFSYIQKFENWEVITMDWMD